MRERAADEFLRRRESGKEGTRERERERKRKEKRASEKTDNPKRYALLNQGVFVAVLAAHPCRHGCNVPGAGGVVAATCTHTTTSTGCAIRAIRQIRHNRVHKSDKSDKSD